MSKRLSIMGILMLVSGCIAEPVTWTSRGGNACEWHDSDGGAHYTPDDPGCDDDEPDAGGDASVIRR